MRRASEQFDRSLWDLVARPTGVQRTDVKGPRPRCMQTHKFCEHRLRIPRWPWLNSRGMRMVPEQARDNHPSYTADIGSKPRCQRQNDGSRLVEPTCQWTCMHMNHYLIHMPLWATGVKGFRNQLIRSLMGGNAITSAHNT